MRGCFLHLRRHCGSRFVFPAHAGVFPQRRAATVAASCLPRACGGVSPPSMPSSAAALSSPRMRGCFRVVAHGQRPFKVFPAHAGVFPHCRCFGSAEARLPRACGGVSFWLAACGPLRGSSPRMRGCFCLRPHQFAPVEVFPAHAGVFPRCRLPMRSAFRSSPRMRGCFRSRVAQN